MEPDNNKTAKLEEKYYTLLAVYEQLVEEADKLSKEEKHLHSDIVGLIDQEKIDGIKAKIAKIKE